MLKIVENRDEWKAGEELLLLDEIAREGARRIHYPASDQPRSPAFTDSFPRVGTAGASPRSSRRGPAPEKALVVSKRAVIVVEQGWCEPYSCRRNTEVPGHLDCWERAIGRMDLEQHVIFPYLRVCQ
jgi:hypothetical protein